ncbi:MAG TPA: M48 family metalloprotease [Gemmatimonadaceae bacterium]|nr:M48 family metalloprotease [Gemmatimonadaceae bacterium]
MSTNSRMSLARAASRRAAVVGGALLLAACATNPVTGRRELALVSEQQEIAMGQEGAKQVEATMGLVQDQELQQYVERIGMRLAKGSQRPNLPWRFGVIDDPTPNAFALPGGPVYITRGMLSLMENEAQLATVLGHEIGHITARHSVQQLSQQQLAQFGLGIGSILSPTVAQFGNIAAQGLQLLFLKYGRDDERESDELGFKYALAQGYDVREAGDPFRALQRMGERQSASGIPSWLSTHPDPGERVATAERRAAAIQPPPTNAVVNEAGYLEQLRGLVYGANPRDGFFEGGNYYHPELRFHLRFPQGWKTQDTPEAVVAVSPQQDAILQLTLAPAKGAQQAAQQFFSQQGLQAGQVTRETVNGLPAVSGLFQAQTQQGTIQGLAVFLDYGGNTFQLLGYAPVQRFGTYESVFRGSASSFARLTDPAKLNVQPARMEIERLTQPTTLASYAARKPSAIGLEELAVINQVEDPNATLPAGTLVKRVVKGS